MTQYYDRHVKSYCIFNKITISWLIDENDVRVTSYYVHPHYVDCCYYE